jgi:hypothetical protein
MPALGADFGVVLAYIVPGFITLWALSYFVAPVAGLFRAAGEGDNRFLVLFALIVVCLGTGMFLSILRAGTIDVTFEVPVPLCNPTIHPPCGEVPRVDPAHVALTCQGVRESFLLAESREKRPFQFYGNMVLAITVVALTVLGLFRASQTRLSARRLLLVTTMWTIVAITFYCGARLSHYRFMAAVTALNKAPCPPTK